MKNIKILLVINVLIFLLIPLVYADAPDSEANSSIWDGIIIEKFITKNPFRPQLPEKEEIQKVIPKDTKPDKIDDTKKNLWDRFKDIKPDTTVKTPVKDIIKSKPIVLPELKITGLIWNTNRPQAIVNGQIVDIGDTISATKIVAIRKTGIDISFEGITQTISP